jgi:acyl-coenzyme A synthetase/AMP-(fatty) acid ligase
VLDAAAVGIPDRHYRQEIMACDESDLRGFATRTLGPYKTPKIFRFVTELPRGPSGKVQRLKLLEGAAAPH